MAVQGPCCLHKLEGATSATCDLRHSVNRQPFLRRKFAASRGVRSLHHLADSGQGFPADSQRGAIALAIDAKTLQAFRISQARINKTGNKP